MEEFKRGVVVFVATVVLATGSPALAQSSSGLLTSAERVALAVEVEQDETVVRRRRSGGLALTGSALAVAGIVLALRPPVCELGGLGTMRIDHVSGYNTYDYEALHRDGKCDVRMARTIWWQGGGSSTSVAYYSNRYGDEHVPYVGFVGDAPVTKKTWNYVGWTTAAAGGALMWFGLRGVEVPVRLDVEPTGGFRLRRSLGW